jgi:hypothetical protein
MNQRLRSICLQRKKTGPRLETLRRASDGRPPNYGPLQFSFKKKLPEGHAREVD